MDRLRHRQLLLSLKFATIEACFSVPMLQLTQGHMPFAIGFAVEALGWRARGVGLLAATPFLAYVLQVPISLALQPRFSLHAIVRGAFVANATPWFLVLTFPLLAPGGRDALFAAISVVSAIANAVCAVAWSSAMSDLVPPGIRGRYFGRRNLIYGFWTLVALLGAGQVADWTHNSLAWFGVIFAAAATSRLVGLFYFSRMTFPQQVTQRHRDTVGPAELLRPLRDHNALRLLAFHGLFGFFLFMALPFYSVFVLRGLGFSLGSLTVLTTLANLAGLVSVSTWAPLSDRFGVKPVMTWSMALWALLGAGLWLITSAEWRLGIFPSFVLYGFMWTLFQLLQFNFMLKMAPAENRTPFISTFFATTYLFWLAGPIVGGYILAHLPEVCGHVLGTTMTRFHLVFVGSMALCLGTLLLLHKVREPDAASVRDLARHLRSSPDANPLLLLVSAAQELFGGRALESLLRQSRRQVRRQTMALVGVGGDLATEGWRTLRRPFDRRHDDDDTV